MTAPRLTGCGTALVTPFNADGSIDEAALSALVDWQIEEGIHFLVPCGSTGEAATMTLEEHCRAVLIVVKQAKGRVPIVAGAGSNDTKKAIELSLRMRHPHWRKMPGTHGLVHWHFDEVSLSSRR